MIRSVIAVVNDFSGGQDTKIPIIALPLNKSPNMLNFHSAGISQRLMKRGGFSKINSTAVPTDDLDAYYPPGYQTYDYSLRDTATNTELSQGFKANTTNVSIKVKVWLKKVGTPTGNINIEIQTDSSDVPSGTAVTNGTSDNVDVSTLGTSYGWVTFTFSTDPSLTSGTQYHLVLQGDFTISTSNYVDWGVDDYDVIFADGDMSANDGTTWTTSGGYNACFEVYITGGAKGDDGVAIWDFASRQMLLGVFGTNLYKMDKNSAGTPDGVWDAIDGGSTWDSYTKLMLHCDGADGSTTFTDEIGHVMTANDNAQIDTAQKKFGTASALLPATGDYLSTPNHADWSFGTGDFTVDFWARFSTHNAASNMTVYLGTDFSINYRGTTNLQWKITVEATEYVFNWEPTDGVWYHIAVVRKGNGMILYIDGTKQGSTRDVTGKDIQTSNALWIGFSDTDTFDGWLDEIRISKGIARWTANFTPETSAYSAASLAITSSRYWTFTDWQSGRALINTDVGLYTYIGTGSASTVSAAPIGKFVTIFKRYVFMAGVRGSPNVVRYSDLSDYTTWTAANTLNFDTNDGDVITAIRVLKGKLYVFKRYSVHRVSYIGSNPTFQVDPILGMGTPSHYTVKEVDMGGDLGTVLVFLTSDKKLAVFDGYNIQVINESLSEKGNDLFAAADDQPKTFADMNLVYADLFHAVVKQDTNEYILYCVLDSDTSVKYAFVLDYKTGGLYPYDNQIFTSSGYIISTNKAKILYAAGYSGYMWQLENGNNDDGTAINAYWVSGKIKPKIVSLMMKMLLLGINFKEITSASTLNINFQYRIDWNVSWTAAQAFNFDHNDELSFGKTALFDIGTVENMFQIKLQDDSSNPASVIYGLDLYGKQLGQDVGEKAVT